MEKPRYDVFLSHATPDKPAVEKLARILRMQGIEPWLDIWNLIPGEPWQEAIEEALESCATCAVCIGPSGTGPWQNEEMRAAIERRVSGKEKRFRVIPVLLPHSMRGEPSRLPPFLRNTGWVELRETLDDEKVLHRLISGIRGVQPGPGPGEAVAEGAQPYRGLEVFDVSDAPFFFGREALTEWLLDKLRPAPNSSRFLAIFGPSGSGKSSLARAGLLVAIKRGEIAGSDSWPATVFKPGDKPLEALAVHLSALAGFPPVLALFKDLATDKRALHLNARVALSGAPADRRLLVLVDQFEEVFTLCSDETQRTAFIDNLLHAAMAADGPTVIVLTLRADFYGRCAVYPDLAAAVSDRQTLVGPMTPDELRSAIERPAYLTGCELEGGLTELLLKEVEAQAGSLPLLEYALLQIWKHREGRRLTTDAYNEIHGVTGALEKRAEEVYASLTETEGEVCRRVFLRLVQVDEQGRATKRRRRLAELTPETEPGRKTTESIIVRFTDTRLLIAAAEGAEKHPTLELVHEALLTRWKRLADWIEQNRESLQTRRRLDEAVTEWLGNDKDPSFLYRGARLAQAEEWAGKHPGEVSPEAKEFLATSRAQEENEAQRELAQARALEEEQRRRAEAEQQARRRLRKWTIASAATAVGAGIAFGIALYQYTDLEDRRRIEIANELGEKSQAISPKDPSLALLLSIEAVRLAEKAGQPHLPAAEQSLRAVLSVFRGTPLPTGKVRAVSLSSDRQWLAVAATDGEISLWHLTDRGYVNAASVAQLQSSLHLVGIAVSPGGRWVLVSFKDGPSTLFGVDPKTGGKPHSLKREDWLDPSDPFSPDGHWLLTRRKDRWILRDLTRSFPTEVTTLKIDPKAVVFSPDGRWLALAEKGALRIGDMRTIRPRADLGFPQVHREEVDELAFSSDSRWLVVAPRTAPVQAWRLEPGQGPDQVHLDACAWRLPDGPSFAWNPPGGPSLRDPSLVPRIREFVSCLDTHASANGRIAAIVPDPEAMRLALGFADGAVLLESLDSSLLSETFRFQAGPIQLLSFQSRWLITQGGNDPPRALKVIPGLDQGDIEPAILASTAGRGAFGAPSRQARSPDNRWLAAIGPQGQLLVWNVRDDGSLASPVWFPFQYLHSQPLTVLAFSPDNRWLASGDEAGNSLLWNLQTPGKEPRSLTKHSGPVTALTFRADSHQIATAGKDGKVWIRALKGDLARTDLSDLPESGKGPITALALLPDGRLAIGGLGGSIRLWSPNRGEISLVSRLVSFPTESISALVASPKGNGLAVSSSMGGVEIWIAENGNLPLEPVELTSASSGLLLAFTQDGNGLLTTDLHERLRRWELRTDKLLATACRAVGRNLTEKEWKTYIPSEPYQEREPCHEFPKAF